MDKESIIWGSYEFLGSRCEVGGIVLISQYNLIGRIKERSDESADTCEVGGSATLDPPYNRCVDPAF